jgi:hypothetical protein
MGTSATATQHPASMACSKEQGATHGGGTQRQNSNITPGTRRRRAGDATVDAPFFPVRRRGRKGVVSSSCARNWAGDIGLTYGRNGHGLLYCTCVRCCLLDVHRTLVRMSMGTRHPFTRG